MAEPQKGTLQSEILDKLPEALRNNPKPQEPLLPSEISGQSPKEEETSLCVGVIQHIFSTPSNIWLGEYLAEKVKNKIKSQIRSIDLEKTDGVPIDWRTFNSSFPCLLGDTNSQGAVERTLVFNGACELFLDPTRPTRKDALQKLIFTYPKEE